MNPEVKALLEKGKALYQQGVDIGEKAKSEERDMTAEEREKVEKMFKDALAMKSKAEAMTKADEEKNELESFYNSDRIITPFESDKPAAKSGEDMATKAIVDYMRHSDDMSMISPESRKTLTRLSAPDGGFWVSNEMESQIRSAKDNFLYMREICDVMTVGAGTHGIPVGDLDATAYWVGDNVEITESDPTTPAGQLTLVPHDCGALLNVPNSLLRDASFDLNGYIIRRLARALAAAEEETYISGNGVAKPLGLLNAGLTGHDITTGTSDTIETVDLGDLDGQFTAAYRTNLTWLMPRYVRNQIKLLKTEDGGDGTGRFIWEPDFTLGQPDRLLGYPVRETEYGFTASGSTSDGDALLILGDFRQGYAIADRVGISVRALTEVKASYNQTQFIAMMAVDGTVIDTNAFIRLNRT